MRKRQRVAYLFEDAQKLCDVRRRQTRLTPRSNLLVEALPLDQLHLKAINTAIAAASKAVYWNDIRMLQTRQDASL